MTIVGPKNLVPVFQEFAKWKKYSMVEVHVLSKLGQVLSCVGWVIYFSNNNWLHVFDIFVNKQLTGFNFFGEK